MLSKIIVHKVGNKINQENLFLSEEELQIDEDMKELLTDYFLNAFKSEEQFQFYSDSYLSLNPIYSSTAEIFEDRDKFRFESENIAKHLFEITDNPRVQGGELFVVYFEGGITEEGNQIDSIGIFKTENKNPFLKILPRNEDNETYDIEKDYGISLSKLDKGCLIYNTDKESGFAISVVDNNKNGDQYYWFEDFLKVKQRDDEYFHTQETLSVFNVLVIKQFTQEFDINKTDEEDFQTK